MHIEVSEYDSKRIIALNPPELKAVILALTEALFDPSLAVVSRNKYRARRALAEDRLLRTHKPLPKIPFKKP